MPQSVSKNFHLTGAVNPKLEGLLHFATLKLCRSNLHLHYSLNRVAEVRVSLSEKFLLRGDCVNSLVSIPPFFTFLEVTW